MHKTGSDEFLYIFLHMPKSAGTSFIRTVLYNLPMQKTLVLAPTFEHSYQKLTDVEQRLESLSQERKDSIRFVAGHCVYYGIHEFFKREARYITFLRHPVDQAISNYLHIRKNFSYFVAEGIQILPRTVDAFTFDWWWQHNQHNIQTAMVLNYQFNGQAGWKPDVKIGTEEVERAKRLLRDFYFVGLQETFDEDALYLYSHLGVNRIFRARQNISARRGNSLVLPNHEAIAESLKPDLELYAAAVDLNRSFRNDKPEYRETVTRMNRTVKKVISLQYTFVNAFERLLGQKRALMIIGSMVSLLKRILGRSKVDRVISVFSRSNRRSDRDEDVK